MAAEIIPQPAYGQTIEAIAQASGTTVDDVLMKLGEAGIDLYNAGEIAKWAEDAFAIKLTPMFKNELAGYAIVENVPIADQVTTAIAPYNSNTQIQKYGVQYVTQTSKEIVPSTGEEVVTWSQGATKLSTGQNILAVLGAVNAATAAASVSIALGKTIDSALYNANPDFWDAQGMSSLNPDTWSSITNGEAGLLGNIFDFVFGIDQTTGATQAYMDETAYAYLAQWLSTTGALNSGESSIENVDSSVGMTVDETMFITGVTSELVARFIQPVGAPDSYFTQVANNPYGILAYKSGHLTVYAAPSPWQFNTDVIVNSSTSLNKSPWYHGPISNERVRYFRYISGNYESGSGSTGRRFDLPSDFTGYNGSVIDSSTNAVILAKLVQSPAIEGIGNDPNATQPSSTTAWTSPTATLQDLQTQYPDLWNDAVTVSNVDPTTGNQVTHTYVPVPWPQINPSNATQPTSSTSTQTSPEIRPDTDPNPSPDTLTKTIVDTTTTPADPTTNPPDTGEGTTPVGPLPAGTSSALFAIYNPTQSEVDQFGAWLWSPDFVDQLKKLFNDPMQSIIGLHKVFAQPIVGGRQNIGVGYLDSGVASNTVSHQYTTVDCGSVSLSEYFGNVFDYDPFTDVQIYLPFVGIQKLNTADVMRSTIQVQYKVDVLTGACLATVIVTRDNAGGTLYQYAGNCAVQYPLSAGSYMGIVSTVASVATSLVGGLAAGGIGGALVGAGMTALHGQGTRVSHAGSLSGNAGAMGIKKPYLIISRPQTKLASIMPHQQGYPTNYGATLGSYSGFVRCRSVNTDGVSATETELKEIERLLMSGVIV